MSFTTFHYKPSRFCWILCYSTAMLAHQWTVKTGNKLVAVKRTRYGTFPVTARDLNNLSVRTYTETVSLHLFSLVL